MNTTISKALLILVTVFLEKGINGRRCERKKSTGEINHYCCDNHEEINETCFECKDGYISESGEVCQQCKSGLYGRRCVYLCNCPGKERCHHLHGCVEIIDETTTAGSESKTQTDHIHSTTDTILIKSKENEKTSKTDFFLLGLSKREVIVYSVGIGGCSIGILICIVCACRYKSKTRIHTVETNEPLPDNDIVQMELLDDSPGGLYEEIDESKMSFELDSTVHRNEHIHSTASVSEHTLSLRTSSISLTSDLGLQSTSSEDESDQRNSLSKSSKSSDNDSVANTHSTGSELEQANSISTISKSSESDDITSLSSSCNLNPYETITWN